MVEEIKKLNLGEEELKKYNIRSIQVISESGLEEVMYIHYNSGVVLNSNLHRYEINTLISSIKSDNRNNKINQIINE